MKENNVFETLIFSMALLGFSFYGLISSSHYVHLLINLDTLIICARIALVAILLAYVFMPKLRTYTARTTLYIGGIFMIVIGAASTVSSTFMGYNISYILLADSLLLVEAGILSIILGADLSVQRSNFMAKSFHYIQSLIPSSQPEVLAYNSTLVQLRLFKTKSLLKTTPIKT